MLYEVITYSDADFNPDKVDIFLMSKDKSIQVAEDGRGLVFDEDLAKEIV